MSESGYEKYREIDIYIYMRDVFFLLGSVSDFGVVLSFSFTYRYMSIEVFYSLLDSGDDDEHVTMTKKMMMMML